MTVLKNKFFVEQKVYVLNKFVGVVVGIYSNTKDGKCTIQYQVSFLEKHESSGMYEAKTLTVDESDLKAIGDDQ